MLLHLELPNGLGREVEDQDDHPEAECELDVRDATPADLVELLLGRRGLHIENGSRVLQYGQLGHASADTLALDAHEFRLGLLQSELEVGRRSLLCHYFLPIFKNFN